MVLYVESLLRDSVGREMQIQFMGVGSQNYCREEDNYANQCAQEVVIFE